MKKLFLLFLFLLFGGCRLKKKNTFIFHHYNEKKNTWCTIAACGIECRQCVLAALHSLQKVKRIKHIDCVCPKQQYEKARFECYIERDKEKSLPIREIVQAFARENFTLKSIEGEFWGIIDYKNLKFTPVLFDKGFDMVGVGEKFSKNECKKEIMVSGKIDFEEGKFYID